MILFMDAAIGAAGNGEKIMNAVSTYYIEGIKEGRTCLKKHGTENFTAQERLDNLNSTIKGFSADTPVGQMLRGERDFWLNQIKRAA